MKYHIITLGCQMNKSDSERVRTVIEELGYCWTDVEGEADLLGILACSVRQKSIDKVYTRIARWNHWKNQRSILTFVTGCVLPADREKFLKMFDLVFPVAELSDLPDMIHQYGVVSQHLPVFVHEKVIQDFWMVKPTYESDYEAYIPIQNGCDKFCTYCAVPYTRGREISRSSNEILAELKLLVDKGYKTITLLGQNVNSYGLDKAGSELTFAQLLRAVGEYGNISGRDFWVYFTSPHPRDMTREVLETIAEFKCLAKQIHLPLQSGDDEVLKKMNRRHTYAEYCKIVEAIRDTLPEATLFTDIIVGFSGETTQQFENSKNALRELHFNMAYIATYSPRPGSASARWEDDIPVPLKKQRLHELTQELMNHSLSYNQGLIGKPMKVLVTGTDRKPGYLSAITEGRIVARFASENIIAPGTFMWLTITGAAAYSIEGKILQNEHA
jgi:tRNA-2-methylthio-N6-dimethylallyladenosine synthase